ncbi:MAG: 1-acyl-sn-glycerol-3-phosphate acyltransferase [Bacteroidota bacterium]
MEHKKLIDVKNLIASKNPKLAKWIPSFVINYLKRILHEDQINKFINENGHLHDAEFAEAVVHFFNLKIEMTGEENIPLTGPVILVMNHPLGGLDAVSFIAEISKRRRSDLKFIVNDLLMNLKNLNNVFVGVNKHGKNKGEVRKNIADLFKSDQMVCVFPAGMVSRKINGQIIDLDWKKTFLTYADELENPIVPIHISGRLSPFFYRLSKIRRFFGIKTNLEMLYLSDEMFRYTDKTLHFTIGKPIYANQIPFKKDKERVQFVKDQVYALSKNQ